MIPQLYFDYMRSGDARPLKSVFYHNAIDVLSMAALLQHMADLLDNPLHATDAQPPDWVGLGRLYESLGHIDTAIELYRQALNGGLPQELTSRTRQQLALIHKRRQEWPTALALWQQAAEEGEVYACVELAKYWEHQQHHFAEAQRWTRLALSNAAASGTSHASRLRWIDDLEHRQRRLVRRGKND
jgi:tetratricopeptide (TPR) repeat protein